MKGSDLTAANDGQLVTIWYDPGDEPPIGKTGIYRHSAPHFGGGHIRNAHGPMSVQPNDDVDLHERDADA